MPYIPPQNRPDIDEKVDVLAEQISVDLISEGHTAEISVRYRKVFMEIANFISSIERDINTSPDNAVAELAATIVDKATAYNQVGAWTGELNYAITMLIQMVPYKMHKKGIWSEALRYWLYAQTVGALTRTAYDLHIKMDNDYVGNGLAGVFEDIKDEYKRRVNIPYEAAQINKSGDCFDHSPYRTKLVPFAVDDTEGFIEVQLPSQDL